MRISLSLLGLDIIDLHITTDTDLEPADDEPDRTLQPPIGFAGAGTGILELSNDRDLDNIQSDHQP